MARFTARHLNKVDRNRRVSVPAPFRSAIEAKESPRKFYLKPNHKLNAIDGLTEAFMDQVQQCVDELDIGSDERLAFEDEYFGESVIIDYDGDGRFVLPRDLMEHAGIVDAALFVGHGDHFQLWKPEAYEAHRASLPKGRPLPKPGQRRLVPVEMRDE